MPNKPSNSWGEWRSPRQPLGLWIRLRAAFAWREVRRDNHYRYEANDVTGERRVVRFNYARGWPAGPPDLGRVNGPPPPAGDDR